MQSLFYMAHSITNCTCNYWPTISFNLISGIRRHIFLLDVGDVRNSLMYDVQPQ